MAAGQGGRRGAWEASAPVCSLHSLSLSSTVAANLPGAPGAQDGETERKPGSTAFYVLAPEAAPGHFKLHFIHKGHFASKGKGAIHPSVIERAVKF